MGLQSRIWTCALGAGLLAACQGGGAAGNNAVTADNAANGAATNSQNVAAAAPVDASAQTGPVARPADSALPAPCQQVIRETQTCIDNLTGSSAGFREGWLRDALQSNRETWASAYDDSYRGPICQQSLETLHSRTADWHCGIR